LGIINKVTAFLVSYFRQVTCFFHNVFSDGIFAGKHIVHDIILLQK